MSAGTVRYFAAGVLAIAGLVVAAPASAAPADPPTWQVDQTTGTNGACAVYDDGVSAQTFTAGVTGALAAVDLPTWTSSLIPNQPSTLSLQIQSVTGDGTPSGTVLGQGSVAWPSTAPVPMDSPIPIVQGTRYAVMLPTYVGLCAVFPAAYAGGQWLDIYQNQWRVRNGLVQLTTYAIPRPTASGASARTSMETPVAIPLPVAPTSSVALTATSGPAHGTVTFAGTTATYTPAAGFAGSDSFRYQAANAGGASTDATVSVDVERPTLAFDTDRIAAGADITVSGTGFPAGSTQALMLHSTPVTLVTVTVSPTGTFSQVVRIPADTAPGSHTITATGPGVTADPAALTVVAATAAAAALPPTGVDSAWLVLPAVGALMLGLGAVVATRRARLKNGV
ncbi:Ig-like domain-containing protein [Pseudolysinimonas sp.]|uniref:Ig-like domain-containing protein n=1 Tax=Pseudolysinimonas sp. TaxID=2680009 RepID=UPI003F81F868